ncbi:hypothetical protein L6164_016820 [Bauhinia variegata]|uniref:Uncharacterized protein n=1 Tax=Bauhinia variegata TaxID=167791 RepID=A0ACB9N5Y7_BAUVA|nr:hypothetical protein L6164_016820 [Bauhinia variegata]
MPNIRKFIKQSSSEVEELRKKKRKTRASSPPLLQVLPIISQRSLGLLPLLALKFLLRRPSWLMWMLMVFLLLLHLSRSCLSFANSKGNEDQDNSQDRSGILCRAPSSPDSDSCPSVGISGSIAHETNLPSEAGEAHAPFGAGNPNAPLMGPTHLQISAAQLVANLTFPLWFWAAKDATKERASTTEQKVVAAEQRIVVIEKKASAAEDRASTVIFKWAQANNKSSLLEKELSAVKGGRPREESGNVFVSASQDGFENCLSQVSAYQSSFSWDELAIATNYLKVVQGWVIVEPDDEDDLDLSFPIFDVDVGSDEEGDL